MKGRWMVDISIKSKIWKSNHVELNGVVGQVNYSNWSYKSTFMNIQQLPRGFCKRAFNALITSHFKRLWNREHQSQGHCLRHSDVPVHILVLWEPHQRKASRRGQKIKLPSPNLAGKRSAVGNEKTVNTLHKLSSEGHNDDDDDEDDDELCLWQRQQ